MKPSAEFAADCMKWCGRVLTGRLAHWCYEWDFLPVDETTIEIESCKCFSSERRAEVQDVIDATILDFRKSDPTDPLCEGPIRVFLNGLPPAPPPSGPITYTEEEAKALSEAFEE